MSHRKFLSAALILIVFVQLGCHQKMFQKPFEEQVPSDAKKVLQKGVWNGKGSAVVLTYDDALHVHLDHAAPALDSQGLKATFYLSGYTDAFQKRLADWRALARKGHELGNHTLFHPCEGGKPGREFVKKDYDLNTYTVSRMEDEIRMMNTMLTALDGKTVRTFAYPCSDTKIGGVSYINNLQGAFTGARAVRSEIPTIHEVDLYNLPSYMVSGQTGDVLIKEVQKAMEKEGLVVFLFHGVGGEHGLDVSLDAHRQLLVYLKEHQSQIWIPTMTDAATFIKEHQKKMQH
jgi:peptidoglycan/xylan/chitin deacetylase (PgdA/CDA1 family)